MNFELSDEQQFLREAARDALSRVRTVEAAREALEGRPLPDLWPTAARAGWPGLLIDEAAGGAGLGALDAMLVLIECGRVLAGIPLLGHLPATALLNADGGDQALLAALASGDQRAAAVLARPPSTADRLRDGRRPWTGEPRGGLLRPIAPSIAPDGAGAVTVDGTAAWVPDAVGATVYVVVGVGGDGTPQAAAVVADQPGVEAAAVQAYDGTRSLGHLTFSAATGRPLDLDAEELATAWYLAGALIAAESLGAVEEALARSVDYAKERFTFGRPIGSYQAIKHALTEVLRQAENSRSLLYYAGWAREDQPDEFAVAASAARSAAGGALDDAARELISVHGGIGATWEHDAPLFFRRAQLSRRLLGGTGEATDRVADELLRAASRSPSG